MVKNGDVLYQFCREFSCAFKDKNIYRVLHLKKLRKMVFKFFAKSAMKIIMLLIILKKLIENSFSITYFLCNAENRTTKCLLIAEICFF